MRIKRLPSVPIGRGDLCHNDILKDRLGSEYALQNQIIDLSELRFRTIITRSARSLHRALGAISPL
jgi:hypothetical protein